MELTWTIVGVCISVIGAVITVVIAFMVDKRTTRILTMINALQIAEMPPQKYLTVLRLLDDMEKSGTKRGTVVQRPDGSWGIDFVVKSKETIGIKESATVKLDKNNS